jgi:hypothetical protein
MVPAVTQEWSFADGVGNVWAAPFGVLIGRCCSHDRTGGGVSVLIAGRLLRDATPLTARGVAGELLIGPGGRAGRG